MLSKFRESSSFSVLECTRVYAGNVSAAVLAAKFAIELSSSVCVAIAAVTTALFFPDDFADDSSFDSSSSSSVGFVLFSLSVDVFLISRITSVFSFTFSSKMPFSQSDLLSSLAVSQFSQEEQRVGRIMLLE